MLKKILYFLAGAALLLLAVFYLHRYTDLIKSSKQFAVKDVNLVTRITIEKDTASVVLEKKQGHWVVNGRGEVKPLMIKRLLYSLQNVEVKAPIPKAIRKMAKVLLDSGYYVTVESDAEILSEFTIAEITNNNFGSIGLVEGKSTPYLLHIPGSSFSIASLITVDVQQWLQNVLVSLQPSDIVSVQVDNIAKPERSFKIYRGTDGNFHIKDLYKDHEVTGYNENQLKFYLSFYSELGYNKIEPMSDIDLKTLVLSQPEALVSISTVNGKSEMLKLFLKPIGDDYDEIGRPVRYDRDKLWVVFNNDRKVALASWIDYDLLLKDVSFFLITN